MRTTHTRTTHVLDDVLLFSRGFGAARLAMQSQAHQERCGWSRLA
jgi:hypothetical protein